MGCPDWVRAGPVNHTEPVPSLTSSRSRFGLSWSRDFYNRSPKHDSSCPFYKIRYAKDSVGTAAIYPQIAGHPSLDVGAVRFGGCEDQSVLGLSPPRCPGSARAMMPCSGSGSKRCRVSSHGAESWASLHEDLLEQIAWRVLAGDLRDYVRFRAVCTHWNSSTVSPQGRGLIDTRFHPRCWMLFPEGHGLYPGHPNLGGYVRFFNLSTGGFVRVHLPLFDDHIVLNSTDGILLLFRPPDTAIRLLHPFTGDIAELPPALPLLQQTDPLNCRYRYMTDGMKLRELDMFLGGVSAAVTVSAAGAITVMLGLDDEYRVAYATTGDDVWSLSSWKLPYLQSQTVSLQGKLYATAINFADKNAYLCQIDPPQLSTEGCPLVSLQQPRMIVKCPLFGDMSIAYLVQCGSELMLVAFNDTSHKHIVVYKLSDLIKGRVVPTTNLEEHVIFIGSRCLCVSAKGLPSILGNSIVCLHRYTARLEPRSDTLTGRVGARLVPPRVEQYDLSSGTWSLAMDEDILSIYTTPMSPYTLAHHVFSCCFCSYWNKGLMKCGAIGPRWPPGR